MEPVTPEIRPIGASHAAVASALIGTSFRELAATDWEPRAQQVFLDGASPEPLAVKLRDAAYAAASFAAGEMVGLLLMPDPARLGMLFVHPRWVRQGIASALWAQARSHVETAHPETRTVELNATPCALPFYRSVGFAALSAEFSHEGCRATRMACWLPARALGAALPAPPPFPSLVPITTPRLSVRPVRTGDLPDLLQINGDPEVTRHLPYPPWRSLEDGRAWLERMESLRAAGSGRQLVLERRTDARVIGTLLLFHHDARSRRVELGYVLGRPHWGQGLMREALGAVCSTAFGHLGLRRIEAEVNPANRASCALLERIGFTLEGRLRQRWVAKGTVYDTNLYACLADEWFARHGTA